MTEAKQPSTTELEWHRKFGMETNHLVWDLLAKQGRTTQEDEMMIHAAQRGANAVINMLYDANEVMSGITEVLCYGSAVQVVNV